MKNLNTKTQSNRLIAAPTSDRSAWKRRGVAIMLVVISVAAATVMTAAYITSRQSAPQVSGNVLSASAARSAAEAGLSMTNAILECQGSNWRSDHVNGVLFEDYPVGNGTVTITVTDLEGNLPTSNTEYVIVRAVGKSNGMRQVAEATAFSPVPDGEINPTYSEFAAFGVSTITVEDSMITRWHLSPDGLTNRPVWLGTSSLSTNKIDLKGTARVLDGRVFAPSDVAFSIVEDTASVPNNLQVVSPAGAARLPIPMAATIDTSVCQRADLSLLPMNRVLDGVNTTVTGILRFDSYTIRNGSRISLAYTGPGVLTRYVTGNVTIDNNSVLIIENDCDLVIGGNLTISNSSGINVRPGVRCRIFVGGNVTVDRGVLGPSRVDAGAITDVRIGLADYKSPAECQLFQISGTGTNHFHFQQGSVVSAQVYAPESHVQLSDQTCFMGSIVGNDVDILTGSVLHYDPSLNDNNGYTNPDSLMYDDPGVLDDDLLAALTDLSDATIDAINSTLDETENIVVPPPDDPTPRTRWVKWRMKRLGIKPVKDRRDNFSHDDDDDGEIDD